MLEELIVTADPAKPPSEPRWRCPLSGCDLEVLYPEELEVHAQMAHPDWAVRRAATQGYRRQEVHVVFQRMRDGSALDEPEDSEDDPECE
jgi:hypothetical protein